MDDVDLEYTLDPMRLGFNFDFRQFIYACLQLPVPIWVLYNIAWHKRRARKETRIDHDAPVLLPIYNYIIYAEIVYVVAKFVLYGFLLPYMDFGNRSGDPIVAHSVFHAFLFMVLVDGMAVFLIVLTFSFLISPTAGKNSLAASLRKAFLHAGFYVVLGIFCMCALSTEYVRAYYVLQTVAPSTVVLFLGKSLLYMYKHKSKRWKGWLYASAWLSLFAWVLYTCGCVAKLAGAPDLAITIVRYIIVFLYTFILPYFHYQALIQDSIYWRNLDKYLFPTESISKSDRLLDHDGLASLCLSHEKGHLDDTLSSFKVPLIDFMHLDSATGLLGKGGYAVVWKAVYHGSPVAVKELLKEKISVKHIKSFFREAVLSTKLNHPNILKFYGACVQPPEFLMIFEWCNQGDLGNYLVKEAMYLNRRARIDMAVQACNGLNALHDRGLIHRDIKPANYLVHIDKGLNDETRTIVKLADFGSCRSMHDKLPLFEGVSPLFVAPEIRKLIPFFFDNNGEPIKDKERPNLTYSKEVDVFGLGWVLWSIFKEENFKTILKDRSQSIFGGQWMPDMSSVEWDAEIVEIVSACWGAPGARPTSIQLFNALFEIRRKHCDSICTADDVALSCSVSSENLAGCEPNLLEVAARQFRDGIDCFVQDVRRLEAVLGEKTNKTATQVLKCAERVNVMAINGSLSTSADHMIRAVEEITAFPYSICRTIMRFRQALDNDIEDFIITQVTTAFTRRTKYAKSKLLQRKCQVFQFEPTSKHREDASYALSKFSARERVIYEHNKKNFAPMAVEFDKAVLWQSQIDIVLPGSHVNDEGGERTSKSVFPMFNFDGKGELFLMLMILFPYFDADTNTYGSFSFQHRIDFHPALKRKHSEVELLRIYDQFIAQNGLVDY